jgi:hypothetical protein
MDFERRSLAAAYVAFLLVGTMTFSRCRRFSRKSGRNNFLLPTIRVTRRLALQPGTW